MKLYLVMVFTLGLTGITFTQEITYLENTEDHTWSLPMNLFKYGGTNHDTLYFSDNGVASFENDTNLLNNAEFGSGVQYIAPLGYNHQPLALGYIQVSGPHPSLQIISDVVKEYNGNTNFVPMDYTFVLWGTVSNSEPGASFQLILTQNEDHSQSYVIFGYATSDINGDPTIGISLGDAQHTVKVWDGSGLPLGCSSGQAYTLDTFPERSQTTCNTTAGLLVFPVHDQASFISRDVCTFEPDSNCDPVAPTTPAAPPKRYRACKARANKRR